MHRYDASYAVEVQRSHPGRFAIVKPVDPDDPAVADVVADWKNTPGTVGIRIILTKEAKREPNDPGLSRSISRSRERSSCSQKTGLTPLGQGCRQRFRASSPNRDSRR
jgi:hypothetical protein